MTAYYNEFDPKAAAWLRELIKAGHIAPGDVDERSIVDIRPSDLIGYTQCHFFAGIGVWSYALRRAGWPDDRPVWTGSCPCQPFSAAGKGEGFTDERHLWPHFHWLIENCRPPVVFGEQVASKDGLGWLDLVQADLEGSGYASGAVDTCAAGFGAPHIRQRLYWVGKRLDDATSPRHDGQVEEPERKTRHETRLRVSGAGSGLDGLADTNSRGSQSRAELRQSDDCFNDSTIDGMANSAGVGRIGRWAGGSGHEPGEIERSERLCDVSGLVVADSCRAGEVAGGDPEAGEEAVRGTWPDDCTTVPLRTSTTRGLAYDNDDGCFAPTITGFHNSEHHFEPCWSAGGLAHPELQQRPGSAPGDYEKGGRHEEPAEIAGLRGHRGPSPTNGHWRDADWLFCRDGKWRPVEPGTFPLAHGAAARVGRLRGYGNAIVAPAAQAFIEAYLEIEITAANDNHCGVTFRPAA